MASKILKPMAHIKHTPTTSQKNMNIHTEGYLAYSPLLDTNIHHTTKITRHAKW